MTVEIAPSALDAMRSHAKAALPRECCGILLGRAGCIEAALAARNVHPAPERHFEIDPQALVDAHRAARAGGPQVLGYYHSHPHGPARPSATDRAQAPGDGRIWAILAPGAGKGDVTFWSDGGEGFTPLSYTTSGG